MDGLVKGLTSLCSALQPVAGAVLIVALVITGISAIKDGADGKMKMKENLTYIIIGAAIAFTATTLGKAIAGWFGYTMR